MNQNDGLNRRLYDQSTIKTGKKHKVNADVTDNRKLDNNQRLENIEHDVTFNTQVLYEVLEHNKRYTVYLEQKIKHEEQSVEFWTDIRKKLVSAGIIGVVGLIFTALWFAFKEFIGKV